MTTPQNGTSSSVRATTTTTTTTTTGQIPGQDALSVTPSTQWYGDDGSWSAISLRIGSPPQWVDVFVNTVSSETWAVGPGGCDNDSECASLRGGVFVTHTSSTWVPLGFFELGIDKQLGNNAYADYGRDDLWFGATGVLLEQAIIGSINDTSLWLGEFGLGVVPGNFTTVTAPSALMALSYTNRLIPSRSYGYTAGAKYQLKGTPTSLTLGGYDANRFVPHNVSFNLNPSQAPQVYMNEISMNGQNGTSIQLLNPADKVYATIDSSTPYLWLPQAVCDRFSKAMGLTYNSTLNLYTFDGNDAGYEALQSANLTFTFSLSDLSTSPAAVNISLPYLAFQHMLTFPFIPNTTYGDADSEKPYFALRPATTEAQFTIGRAFLQEAYIITDYERNNFSIHQAIHTANPLGDTNIVAISGTYPEFITESTSFSTPLDSGAEAGISIAAIFVTSLIAAALYYFYRRRRRRHDEDQAGDMLKDDNSKPRSFLSRFRRSRQPKVHEADGTSKGPVEASSENYDPRFELPAPVSPAELDGEAWNLPSTVSRLSTLNTQASTREDARRKLERQLRIAAQAQALYEMHPIEKKTDDSNRPSSQQHLAPTTSEYETPLVSPLGMGSEASFTAPTSPVSPAFQAPAATPASPPPVYRRIGPGDLGNVHLPPTSHRVFASENGTARSDEYDASAESNNGTSTFDPEAGSETLDSTKGVPYRHNPPSTSSSPSHPNNTNLLPSSARSSPNLDDFKFRREDVQSLKVDMQKTREANARESRIEGFGEEELIHVPQVAERRFSWEDVDGRRGV